MADAKRPEVGKYGKVFKGSEGARVEMVRVGPADAGEVLLKITGVDHPWDGQVMKLKAKPAGNGMDYAKGDRNILVERTSWGTMKSYELYLEGAGKHDLTYDEALSKESLPEHLLTEYLEQVK